MVTRDQFKMYRFGVRYVFYFANCYLYCRHHCAEHYTVR